jgi:hypothetical protein
MFWVADIARSRPYAYSISACYSRSAIDSLIGFVIVPSKATGAWDVTRGSMAA